MIIVYNFLNLKLGFERYEYILKYLNLPKKKFKKKMARPKLEICVAHQIRWHLGEAVLSSAHINQEKTKKMWEKWGSNWECRANSVNELTATLVT